MTTSNDRLRQANEQLRQDIQVLSREIQGLAKVVTQLTRGQARGAAAAAGRAAPGAAPVGGALGKAAPALAGGARAAAAGGAIAGGALRGGLLGVGVGLAKIGAQAAGGGIINATRGGTFGAGAIADLKRQAVARLPSFITEVTGLGAEVRAEDAALAQLNALTNRAAAFGVQIPVSQRQFATETLLERARRVELNRQTNQVFINEATAQIGTLTQTATRARIDIGG